MLCAHFSRKPSIIRSDNRDRGCTPCVLKHHREPIDPYSYLTLVALLFKVALLYLDCRTNYGSFTPMSSNSPDIAAYYLNYKSAVYQNLFSGIVYGEQPLAFFCSSIISSLSC